MNAERTLTALLVGVAASLASCSSLADGLPAFELVGKAGYLSNLRTVGVGGRVGYSFSGVYAGLSVMDYLPIQSGLVNGVTAEAEIGYGFRVSFLTIRPLLGIGVGFTDSPPCIPSPPEYMKVCDGSGEAFVLQPGGLVQLGFGPVVFGVASSALLSFGSIVETGAEVDGQVGVRF